MTTSRDYGACMNQEYVAKSEFKAKALEYFRQVEDSGKAIVITDRGRPTVEVRRYRLDQRPPLEKLQGSVVVFNSLTEPVAEGHWENLA